MKGIILDKGGELSLYLEISYLLQDLHEYLVGRSKEKEDYIYIAMHRNITLVIIALVFTLMFYAPLPPLPILSSSSLLLFHFPLLFYIVK